MAFTELASGLIISDDPAGISPPVNEPLKVVPPVVVLRMTQPFSTAVRLPVFVISKNSSFVDSLFSSNMNLLKIKSFTFANDDESGSGAPGVGHGSASPSEFIVLQSVVIVQTT